MWRGRGVRSSRSRDCAGARGLPSLGVRVRVRAGPCSALPSPALRGPAPHVLFGWVSNGGRGDSAAGRRLRGLGGDKSQAQG